MPTAQAIATAADALYAAARAHKRAAAASRDAARAAMQARAVLLAELGIRVEFRAQEAQRPDGHTRTR